MKHTERITELTSAWIDGQATEEDKRELNDLLQGDPEACELYLDLMEAHGNLTFELSGDGADSGFGPIPPELPEKPARRSRRLTSALALAAALSVLVLLIQLLPQDRPIAEPMTEGGGVAVVSRLVNTDGPYAEGDIVQPGRFVINSGFAQLEFFCGATVILEAPAELEIESTWLAKCHHGRLRVSVPEPARGFTIQTRDYRAVDLGTEFAMEVSQEGPSEVHVFEGEVRLDDFSGNPLTNLTDGKGVRTSGAKTFENLDVDTDSFVSRQQLQSLVTDSCQLVYERWHEASRELREDSTLLRYFDFEDQKSWDRQLVNRASSGSNAAIIGSKWSEGRWPGKGALEFQRVSDRVRLTVPGEFEAISLVASVRIQGFDRWLSSLILTDGFEAGEVHWQISDQGEMILGIGAALPGINTYSPPVIRPGDLGRWLQVAVTIDRGSGEVIHYLDGKEVAREIKKEIPPLRFGNAEIGNWQSQANAHPIRSFNGRIDEFMIFQRALSAAEIKELTQTH